jgi:hypothetical protein
MSLILEELVGSRSLSEGRKEGALERTLEKIYVIKGTDDPEDPDILALGPQSGEALGDGRLGLFVSGRKFDVLKVNSNGSDGALKLTITYGPPERLPNNNESDPEYELSTMAETAHIEQAQSQTHYPSDPNHVGTAIGVTSDKIEGVDIYVPKGTYTQTKELASLSSSYRAMLMNMTGTINSAAWKGWNAFEVLFLGVTARRKGYGIWKLQYSFAIQPSVAQSFDTVSGTVGFTKLGWDYMWLERVRSATDDGTQVQQQIEAVHVARVYQTSNFGALGLGN